MKVICAFYKGGRNQNNLYSKAIKAYTKSDYSHMEIWDIENMQRYTSSASTKGVVKRPIKSASGVFDKNINKEWDFLEVNLPCATKEDLENFYLATKGDKYDFSGILGFVLPIQDRSDRWFCSEWCVTFMKNHNCQAFAFVDASQVSPQKAIDLLGGIKK